MTCRLLETWILFKAASKPSSTTALFKQNPLEQTPLWKKLTDLANSIVLLHARVVALATLMDVNVTKPLLDLIAPCSDHPSNFFD
jgi:hypothetical protein